jgi:hypothetical protein
MAQQNDSNGLAPALSPDRTLDPVAIFSAPDVVLHWWAESKRRWAEQDRAKALTVHPAVVSGPGYALSVDSE